MSACPRPAACGIIVSNKSRVKKKKVKKYYSKKKGYHISLSYDDIIKKKNSIFFLL